MKKRRVVAALLYATTTICLFGFVDFLYGAEPPISHLVYLLIAGTVLFGFACTLSLFVPKLATVCALCAAALSWVLLSSEFGRMDRGRNLVWLITYEPDTPAAILSLIVSSVYATLQFSFFLRTDDGPSERNVRWALPAAVLYALAMLAVANWRSIWDWCFRLRYGS